MDSTTKSTDGLLVFLAWLDKNKKRVILIAGATLAAVAIIAGVVYYQSQKEARASEALSNVRKPFNPSLPAPPDAAQAYLQIAHDFEGTKAGGRALLEAGSIFYTQGSYAEAETQYKRFLNEYPDSPFVPQGMLGLGSALDAEGKSAEAIDQYDKIRKRFASDSVIDETKLALARLYEKQNLGEAYKLYSELAAAGSQSGIGSEAGIRLADLMEKNPEFLKTNAPPAPMVPPTQPVPQATISRTGSTNQVVMKMTNLSSMPATTAPTNKTATGAASAAPLLIKPAPSTNKP